MFEHLQASAQILAMQSPAERLAKFSISHWIGYSRANEILEQIETLMTNEPGKTRPQNLLIIAPSNNGKTMLAEKFCRSHPRGITANKEYEDIPVLMIQMPASATISMIYTAFLLALGSPVGANYSRLNVCEMLTLKLMREVGVRVIIIDELHNLLDANAQRQREILSFIRFLGNELRIPIVGMGIRDAYLAIRSDNQLENRFHPRTLPKWEYNEEFVRLLATFESVIPLREPSGIADEPLCELILRHSEGTIGEIVSLLNHAVRTALRIGEERISISILKSSTYKSPSIRSRLVEKELC